MLRRLASRFLSQPTKDRLKLTARTSVDKAPPVVRSTISSYRSWRRYRSPSTVFSKIATHPAVVYGLLSDPRAVEKLISTDKAQHILWSRHSSDEPGVEHVLALLAQQPDRLAGLLADREVQDKLFQTGLMFRSDLEWSSRAAALGDPRVVDSLLDKVTPEQLMLAGPGRTLLVEYLAEPKNQSARLRALLTDVERRRPGSIAGALPQGQH